MPAGANVIAVRSLQMAIRAFAAENWSVVAQEALANKAAKVQLNVCLSQILKLMLELTQLLLDEAQM